MQTLTLPVGVHQIIISEKGTPQQQKAGLLSLFTLATLTIGVWWKGAQWRRLAVVPALCVLAGVFAILQPAPRPDTWRSATTPIARDSLELLGYRYQVEEEHLLHIFPYWLVHKPTDSKVSWQIVDAGGMVKHENLKIFPMGGESIHIAGGFPPVLHRFHLTPGQSQPAGPD